jgi:hypothetical protein
VALVSKCSTFEFGAVGAVGAVAVVVAVELAEKRENLDSDGSQQPKGVVSMLAVVVSLLEGPGYQPGCDCSPETVNVAW